MYSLLRIQFSLFDFIKMCKIFQCHGIVHNYIMFDLKKYKNAFTKRYLEIYNQLNNS